MKFVIASLLLLSIEPYICLADQLVECNGTNIWNHDVVAKVFYNDGIGRIVLKDNLDIIESKTLIQGIDSDTLEIYENDFVMNFSVSKGQSTYPVQAFLQGAFYVEDFTCNRTKLNH